MDEFNRPYSADDERRSASSLLANETNRTLHFVDGHCCFRIHQSLDLHCSRVV